MLYSLEGNWNVRLPDESTYDMLLPGTLDENKIGYKDVGANQWHPDAELGNAGDDFDKDARIATRFTRKYTYEGAAYISRKIDFCPKEGERVFIEAERAKCLKLLVDGREVADFIKPSISTPHVFEVTGLLSGDNEITFVSDNSYPGLPHDDIVYSSAATDETQTNWNGILGFLRIRTESENFISQVRVYLKGSELNVKLCISAAKDYLGKIKISSEALMEEHNRELALKKGTNIVEFTQLKLKPDIKRWDEYEGNLYELTAVLDDISEKSVTYGIRDFGDNGKGRLALNGRTIFVRSEANCAVFPETGHQPMSVEEWKDVLNVYKSYGINLMRFHSHCPPEAAFTAADRLGMLMQPELSHWNPRNAFETEESYSYYITELEQIILQLANHPSFVMLAFGNELQAGELGHERMRAMLKLAQELDDTRMYAEGSNVHYGEIKCEEMSDFYTTQRYFNADLRGIFAGCNKEGHINGRYPGADMNYDSTMEKIRKDYKKPVFSFEVGQFEILPDFDELEDFTGISEPDNLRLIKEKVEAQGLLPVWKKYVEATGELAKLCYREEIEAAMRTKELSGISLLGLQDFPGQGTALVGMLNSHLKPKPFTFAQPEEFSKFFRAELPLVLLPKYTYLAGETLTAEVVMANFGKSDMEDALNYELCNRNFCFKEKLYKVHSRAGELTSLGTISIPLDGITKNARLDLTVKYGGITNSYPIWVYVNEEPVCPDSVYETTVFDEKAKEILLSGGKVYLSPPSTKEAMPSSIQTQFSTDFWSVGTFPVQEGSMGQLIDNEHPIFADFPTESHTNWQWWIMASQRAFILPEHIKAIITEMDCYAYLRPMAQLFEGKCYNGKLLVSSMGLQNLMEYPEARALQASIYRYMDSESFVPEQKLDETFLKRIIS